MARAQQPDPSNLSPGRQERRLRRWLEWLKRTPLHPQWLLPSNHDIENLIALHAKGRLLDIGCSDGWLRRILPADCDYIGLDYPATGGELYGARPDVFADAAELPLAENSIDTVVLLEVLEHLRHPREALHEIARVLRPRGCLLLSMPFLYPIHDAPHDYQRYTVHGLTREIEAAGLRLGELKPSLGSAESAGLIACLALGGMGMRAVRLRSLSLVLLPFILAAIPLVNLSAWLAGRLFPSWDAVTLGYRLSATKP